MFKKFCKDINSCSKSFMFLMIYIAMWTLGFLVIWSLITYVYDIRIN
jgi:hypothetical protein